MFFFTGIVWQAEIIQVIQYTICKIERETSLRIHLVKFST